MLDEEIAFGPGKADLLDAIDSSGSISAAARQMNMSYRRAWLLVDTMNRCFREPLVTSMAGGNQGGGAVLTEAGREVLRNYRTLVSDLERVSNTHRASLEQRLRKQPVP